MSSSLSTVLSALANVPAPVRELIPAAVAVLQAGGLVAFPTETVYGLGADAENPAALDRLYTVKGRPKGHPVIVHVADVSQLSHWACEIPEQAYQLAQAFWPGPLTLILKRNPRVPDAVTGGQDTVGLRVPDHPVALALLQAFGGGIAAPSANRFGRVSPTTAVHVQADLGSDVDLVLDGGECAVGVESTIVAFQNDAPVILRPGMITAEQIESVIRRTAGKTPGGMPSASSTVSRAPGTLASHYAPLTPVHLVASEQRDAQVAAWLSRGEAVGVLALSEAPESLANQPQVVWYQMECDPQRYAQQLYAQLRWLDALQLQRIVVEAPPEAGAWAAVADRLRRAAHGSR
jgi:L-threonylcarbamoyladenylate synthase